MTRSTQNDDRPQVHVHDAYESEDPVRMFYEIPDRVAGMVREAATVEGQEFAGCLHDLVLERNAALVEVRRLKREGRR